MYVLLPYSYKPSSGAVYVTPACPVALTEGIFSLLIFYPPSDFALDGIFLRDENGENFKPSGMRVLTGSG